MIRLLVVLALVVGAAMPAQADPARTTHKGYEMPPYQVLRAEGAFELRQYAAHVLAEVKVTGDRSSAASAGFRSLAGYIFGGNAASDKIAMTVPVTQAPTAGGVWTVRFMMPSAYTLSALPRPDDTRIRLFEQPAVRQVSVGFSGLRSDSALSDHEAKLRTWAQAQGLTITEGPFYYFYDGPATLPWNRRNEVAFSVR